MLAQLESNSAASRSPSARHTHSQGFAAGCAHSCSIWQRMKAQANSGTPNWQAGWQTAAPAEGAECRAARRRRLCEGSHAWSPPAGPAGPPPPTPQPRSACPPPLRPAAAPAADLAHLGKPAMVSSWAQHRHLKATPFCCCALQAAQVCCRRPREATARLCFAQRPHPATCPPSSVAQPAAAKCWARAHFARFNLP